MDFAWDEAKRRENLRKHKVDFAEAPEMFDGPMLVQADVRHDYGEDRSIGYGFVGNRVMAIAFTEHQPGVVRVISL